ncbi:dehydrodolichyl diphosphate synthase 6-like protein [Carex littledalei]|uniref:Alkyl transferase n=1 Tax=Carex littledalei TaxID=544730 RepID=A0A833VGL5_9POAL|nr:dehydrodolichyl diphosphate synthase 6-like protein [Carex littledalei]
MAMYGKSMISIAIQLVAFVMRKCLFSILSMGPVPAHIAFIMDGNRRYAKRYAVHQESTDQGTGHQHATVYAFSIDNFRRDPHEVHALMDMILAKLDQLLKGERLLMKYEVRIIFWGNLELLTEPVRVAVKKVMDMTVHNKGPVLSVCVAYTSTDEITHAVEASVRERREKVQIDVSDLERNLYTAGCVEPDIIIRTSGETRLSNFLLWQSDFTHLQNPKPLWPEFSLRHLVWAVLEYQKVHGYLKKWKGGTEKNK